MNGDLPAGAWQPGAAPTLRHGLRSRKPDANTIDPIIDAVIADLEADLAGKVPIRDENGEVPRWLRELCWTAAIKKLRVIRCQRWLAHHGDEDERGRWRPENRDLERAAESYERSLARLAMTVPDHMRAGLDHARTVSVATAMSEPDPTRRPELYRQAGLELELEGDGGEGGAA